MKLIIAEKPSLAKNIANALNVTARKDGYFESDKYIISFAFGHLFSLKEVDDYLLEKNLWKDVPLPFFPEKFEFKLKDDDGIKKQYDILTTLVNRQDVEEIINCGDADREGQIIVDLILECIKTNKKVTRLWLPEQTEKTIQTQIDKCEDNIKYTNLHDEGLARTYIDWLYGINLTRYTTIKAGTLFPCGRVLIPIVKYIYDRDMEIKNFKEEKYYILESQIKIDDIPVTLSIKSERYTKEEQIKAQQKADELNKHRAKVIDVQNKELKKQPPKLFSLSKLQSLLSKQHQMSFDESMQIIQSLYEKGYITYPRTNTEYLSENEKEKVNKLINHFSSDYNLKMRDTKSIFDDSKIESHSAIIPTDKNPNNLSKEESTIYNVILTRFVCNFLDDECVINQTIVKIAVGDQKIFNLKGQSIKNLGFMKYESTQIQGELPNFFIGQEFDVKFELSEKITTPPKKITEESLSNYLKNPFRKEKSVKYQEMEEDDTIFEEDDSQEYKNILKGIEIGTEATRTGIIQNAKKYDYITQSKQTFSITQKGIYFIETLDKLKIDLYKEKTVETSTLQKQVYKNELSIEECIEKIKKQIGEIMQNDINIEKMEIEKEIIGICPRCKSNIYESPKSYYCCGYNRKENPCTFSIWKENTFFENKGKKLTKSMVKSLLKKGYVEVKGFKSKEKNKEYDAKVVLKDTGKYVNFELDFDIKKEVTKEK